MCSDPCWLFTDIKLCEGNSLVCLNGERRLTHKTWLRVFYISLFTIRHYVIFPFPLCSCTSSPCRPGCLLSLCFLIPFSYSNKAACHYSRGIKKTFWLSTTDPIPTMPLFHQETVSHISSCVECETFSQPMDPTIRVHRAGGICGWCICFSWLAHKNKPCLFSFHLHVFSAWGCCLQDFRTHSFIQCQGVWGSCHYFANVYGFRQSNLYLRSLAPMHQQQRQSVSVSYLINADYHSGYVWRCQRLYNVMHVH